jgi:hypothetical protein
MFLTLRQALFCGIWSRKRIPLSFFRTTAQAKLYKPLCVPASARQ